MDNLRTRLNTSTMSRCFGVGICVLLITTSLTIANDITVENENNLNLCYSFTFIAPKLQTTPMDNSQYTAIQMPGCVAIGKQAGNPMLPVKPVQLLLPALTTVKSVTVVGSSIEFACIEKPVCPYQNPVPFGFEPEDFKINHISYASDTLYPTDIYSGYSIGYCRGYTVMDITLNPVQYNPYEGKLFYYPELTVTITLENTGWINPFFRNNLDDKSWVEKLVYNPETTDTYANYPSITEYPDGLCDPTDDYDYVIITTTTNSLEYWSTNSSIPYNWESLMDKHEQDDGLNCTLVTVQDINACPDYYNSDPLFNDTEAHIREFCKDAYQDWGTKYVLVGGDDEWIPARHMKYSYESNVDSDIYWSNLDNTFNDNQDSLWGEEGDNGFDLYSELFIGRITCDEPQDVSNWLTKSFYYANSNDKDFLENAAFYGGDTGWSCEGDDFIDYSAIKGTDNWLGPNPNHDGPFPAWAGFQYGFETWNEVNPGNEYNLSVKWTAESPNPGWQGGSTSVAVEEFKNAINNNQVTLISAIAHANAGKSLDVNMNSWEADYHNTRPFLIHDYGCHCGDMDDADDGVLHSMLFHSDTELAFACIYNTCYGWGNIHSTNSSSAFQQKEFWNYFFDMENNSGDLGNWQLGKGQAWSKDRMAPTINWDYSYGTWRGIIQGCLLFGDPAQRLKSMTKSPEKPDTPVGTTEGIIEKKYLYTTRTTDPEGEQIYYLWAWGDSTTSEWIGPFNSGETILASHTWSEADTYEIRVKSKDIHNAESSWSDPLIINIIDVPVLKIESINGGLFKINADIKNYGTDAIGVNWSITFTGGIILLGQENSGRIISILAGENVNVISNLIFGFGKTVITVTVECDEGSSDTTGREASVLLFFIF